MQSAFEDKKIADKLNLIPIYYNRRGESPSTAMEEYHHGISENDAPVEQQHKGPSTEILANHAIIKYKTELACSKRSGYAVVLILMFVFIRI
jgi:hypothetical protein